MEETKEQQLAALGEKILGAARTELYFYMRYLDLALSGLSYEAQSVTELIGTDGNKLYYSPELLIAHYKKNRLLVNRAYLHVVFHCIFRHLWKVQGRNRRLWDLACDIAMEYVIDGLRFRCVRMPASPFRREFYNNLSLKYKVPTAEGIYKLLERLEMAPKEMERLEFEFRIDDHTYWPGENKQNPPGTPSPEQKWQEISEKMQMDMDSFASDTASDSQSLMEELRVTNRKKFDYRSFLRRFAVFREEPVLDADSFDTVLYTYGLQVYGNMPLIEPQETRETKKIEEFVIAVDTSMSCSGELVREFLEQTYSVLMETESFFRKVNIHILQCDETIQSDKIITSQEELKKYMESLELKGNGGTDFRPVFQYVEELIAKKTFRFLKGLIYFTDGLGTFPSRRPSFDTAFVFLREGYDKVEVPPWAMKLILDPEDVLPQEDDREGYEYDNWEDRNNEY